MTAFCPNCGTLQGTVVAGVIDCETCRHRFTVSVAGQVPAAFYPISNSTTARRRQRRSTAPTIAAVAVCCGFVLVASVYLATSNTTAELSTPKTPQKITPNPKSKVSSVARTDAAPSAVERVAAIRPPTHSARSEHYDLEGLVFALSFDGDSVQSDGVTSIAGPKRKAFFKGTSIVEGKYGKGMRQATKGGLYVADLKAAEAASVCFWFRLERDEGPLWFFNFIGSHAANHVYPSKDYVDIIYHGGLTAIHPHLGLNEWHHLAFVWDWKQSRCKFFLDGVLFIEKPVPNNFVPGDSKGADIGVCYDDSSATFFMDDFLVFDRQLGEFEIQRLVTRAPLVATSAAERSITEESLPELNEPISKASHADPLSDHLWPTPNAFTSLSQELRNAAARYRELPDTAGVKSIATSVAYFRAFRKLELGRLDLDPYITSSTHGKLYLQACDSSAAVQLGATLNVLQLIEKERQDDTELGRVASAIREGKTVYEGGHWVMLSEDRWRRMTEDAGIIPALARSVRLQRHFNKRAVVESGGGHSVRGIQFSADIAPAFLLQLTSELQNGKIGNLSRAEAGKVSLAFVNALIAMDVSDFADARLRRIRYIESVSSVVGRLSEQEASTIVSYANMTLDEFVIMRGWKTSENLYSLYAIRVEAEWKNQLPIVEKWLDAWCRENDIQLR